MMMILPYFNSIKVQLKHRVDRKIVCYREFQFHKGTIKTPPTNHRGSGGHEFQFHKGTIKTTLISRARSAHNLFQFHKGTIKTYF